LISQVLKEIQMEAEQVKEWQQFQANAIKTLKNNGSHPKNTIKFLQLLILPSFTTSTSCEILKVRNQPNEYIFLQSQWNLEADLEKFRTPIERLKYPSQFSPAIENISQPASNELMQKLLMELEAIRLPLQTQSQTIGLDGTAFELNLYGNSWSVSYCWWNKPPAEWNSLNVITKIIMDYSSTLQKS
jgi:hypothetical protein